MIYLYIYCKKNFKFFFNPQKESAVLLRSFTTFYILFMKPKRMQRTQRSFIKKAKERKRTPFFYKERKRMQFFYQECKRTPVLLKRMQKNVCSNEKNACPTLT